MERLSIFKIGGNVINDEKLLASFLHDFSLIEGKKVLVHGGGKVATSIAEKLGVETVMREGRRVTSDEMIDVVIMTYAGLVNKKIVSILQSEGVNAIGLTGADGNLILSNKRPIRNGVDFGWVGDPKEVNSNLVTALVGTNVPVVAPVTHDGKGHLLNTNADTIANVLAIAMSSTFECELNYCFELAGVMKDLADEGSLIKEITEESYRELKEQGVISDGMVPKLDNAFDAIDKGVSRVRIIHHSNISKLNENEFDGFTNIH